MHWAIYFRYSQSPNVKSVGFGILVKNSLEKGKKN